MSNIKADTQGKWPGIFASLGISVGTGKHQPCPACGGTDRFRFIDKNGTGSYYCSQCKPGDGISLVMKVLKIEFKEACEELEKIIGKVQVIKHQEEQKTSPELLRKIFKASEPVKKGDPAYKYLQNRGLTQIPEMLRYCPLCWEPETKKNQKAMLAIFTLPKNEAVTMHRTYINEDGYKLNIENPKKILPPLKSMTGGAVRLYEHTGQLGIAEGIETAVAIYESYKIPCWAALSSVLLEGFIPPVGVKELIIFGDNDINFTGQKSAYSLANKLSLQGDIRVEVNIPRQDGTDFLNELNSAQERAN